MQSKLNLKEEKIWIAGHTGMVGQALTRRLRDHNLILSSRKELDLKDTNSVWKWFGLNKPSVVFLTAAKVGGIKANAEHPVEFLLDNLKIQNNVIEAAACHGVKKLIFMGSACSYPKEAPQPINENSLFNGCPEITNIWYATAKIAGIKLAQAFHEEKRLTCTIAMPTNSYGPFDNFDEQSGHVIPALMNRFETAKSVGDDFVSIWGTGTPIREFIYVDDLADALVFLSEEYDSSEIVNIGSGEEVSIKELASMVADVIGYQGNIVTDLNRPDGMMRKCLDTTKIHQLGWKPKVSLTNGLNEMYKWAKHNKVL